MVIYKDKETRRMIMHIEGRDLEEVFDFVIEFDRFTCQWKIVGDMDEANYTENEKWLRERLRKTSDFTIIKQWAEAASIPLRTLQNTATRLNVISKTTGVGKDKRTKWRLP
jgi:hypothetical protein